MQFTTAFLLKLYFVTHMFLLQHLEEQNAHLGLELQARDDLIRVNMIFFLLSISQSQRSTISLWEWGGREPKQLQTIPFGVAHTYLA